MLTCSVAQPPDGDQRKFSTNWCAIILLRPPQGLLLIHSAHESANHHFACSPGRPGRHSHLASDSHSTANSLLTAFRRFCNSKTVGSLHAQMRARSKWSVPTAEKCPASC